MSLLVKCNVCRSAFYRLDRSVQFEFILYKYIIRKLKYFRRTTGFVITVMGRNISLRSQTRFKIYLQKKQLISYLRNLYILVYPHGSKDFCLKQISVRSILFIRIRNALLNFYGTSHVSYVSVLFIERRKMPVVYLGKFCFIFMQFAYLSIIISKILIAAYQI